MAEQELVTRVTTAIDGLATEMIDALAEVVRIPSVNPKYPGQVYDDVVGGEGEVSKVFARHYEALGATVDLFAIEPGRENAVCVVKGVGGGRSLIYNGHVDVVPVGDAANWTGDPFSGKIDHDRVWGRGATDMKSGIMAQAFAARALKECGIPLKGDLILEAVVGEEVMDHECGVTATIKRGYTADAAIVSEPSSPPSPLAVVPISPGLLWFSVTVAGKSSHSSMRGNSFRAGGDGASVGVNAIDKGVLIFNALRQLEDEWGLTKQHPLFLPGHFSIHPGVVVGGPHGVMVPFFLSEFMTIDYCVWYSPEDDPEDVKQEIDLHIHRAAQLDAWLREHPPVVDWKMNWPANTPQADEITGIMVQAHEQAAVGTRFAGTPDVVGFAAVEDCTWLTLGGVPAISYGPGDLRVAHADDEYVMIDEVVTACKTYAVAAMDWCGVA